VAASPQVESALADEYHDAEPDVVVVVVVVVSGVVVVVSGVVVSGVVVIVGGVVDVDSHVAVVVVPVSPTTPFDRAQRLS
jgi:hypothetical protein